MTVAAAAEALGLQLWHDEALLARLRRFLEERQIPWLERYGRLALIPQGAVVLDPGGMACGFALKHDDVRLFFCPGCRRRCGPCSTAMCSPACWSWPGTWVPWPSAP